MWWPIYIINSVNYNKITLLYSPTDAAPQYLSNLPPSFICQLVSQIIRQTVSQSVSPIDSQLDTLPVRDLVSQLDCHQTNQSPHPVSEPISHLSMQGIDTLVSQLASKSLPLSSKAFSCILTTTALQQNTTRQFKNIHYYCFHLLTLEILYLQEFSMIHLSKLVTLFHLLPKNKKKPKTVHWS